MHHKSQYFVTLYTLLPPIVVFFCTNIFMGISFMDGWDLSDSLEIHFISSSGRGWDGWIYSI